MDTVGMVIGQLVPRPLRDAAGSAHFLKDKDLVDSKSFFATTMERLVLASLAAGVAHVVPVPRWAVYGATAVVSLPAAVALGASELAYRGLKCISRDPCLLAASAVAFGGSWLLFENYDRLNLNKYGYGEICEEYGGLHFKPEMDLDHRMFAWGLQKDCRKNGPFFSPNFWGMGLGEPALAKFNLWLFSKS